MGKELFALSNFTLAVVMMTGFFAFQHHFSGIENLRNELVDTKLALRDEIIRNEIVQWEFEAFHQKVASYLPQALEKSDDYQIRNLASISLPSDKSLSLLKPENIFDKAKEKYLNGEGNQARQHLLKFIENYPMHPSVVEAHFLMTKSLFDSKEYEQSLRLIEVMLKRYPEHELTGYALMMSADIYLDKERFEDAEFVYKMIKHNFYQHKKLHLEARKRLEKWGI